MSLVPLKEQCRQLKRSPLGSLSEGAVKIGSSEPILTEGVTFVILNCPIHRTTLPLSCCSHDIPLREGDKGCSCDFTYLNEGGKRGIPS